MENIKKYQCAHRVVLEIVESEGIENFSEITAFIHEVKALGCRIAIDDFGTGYSNFAYLDKLERLILLKSMAHSLKTLTPMKPVR